MSRNQFSQDTTILYLKKEWYDCPKLIIAANGDIRLDSSHYVNAIADMRIDYVGDCDTRSSVADSTIIQELCDTIKTRYTCKLAIPTTGYFNYYKHLSRQVRTFQHSELRSSGIVTIDFMVDKMGNMIIEKVRGVNVRDQKSAWTKFVTSWKAAEMWGRRVETNYRLTIDIQ